MGAINKIEEKKQIIKSVVKILKENKLLTLSTVEKNQPHSCSAYYVFDKKLNLYIWTEKNSLHSKHIKKNQKVSINIANSSQKWGSLLKGLQIKAEGKSVSGKEIIKAGSLYIKRFPKVSKYIKKIKDFISGKLESDLYKFKITKIKVLDEKTFGKEEYKELIFKN